jgi:TM2 domain-containing membrane protein YozV
MKKNMYLFVRGKKLGPHDIAEVRKLVSSGEISLYDIAEVNGSKMLLHNIFEEQVQVANTSQSLPSSELPASHQAPDSDSTSQPASQLALKAHPSPPTLNQGAAFFCMHCGNRVITAALICPSCGAPTGNGMPILPLAGNINSNQKSRATYLILAFFLGGCGAHNFYSGHNLSGLLKILLTFVGFSTFGITWLIAFIIVTIEMCTVRQDSKGIPFN